MHDIIQSPLSGIFQGRWDHKRDPCTKLGGKVINYVCLLRTEGFSGHWTFCAKIKIVPDKQGQLASLPEGRNEAVAGTCSSLPVAPLEEGSRFSFGHLEHRDVLAHPDPACTCTPPPASLPDHPLSRTQAPKSDAETSICNCTESNFCNKSFYMYMSLGLSLGSAFQILLSNTV